MTKHPVSLEIEKEPLATVAQAMVQSKRSRLKLMPI
jgi:hypothetical protein